MRFHSFAWLGLAAVAVAGCGPTGPSSLEGFGEIGDTDGVGDGDGDSGNGDGDSGDGDGDCIDASYGSAPQIYIEGELTPALANDFPGFCSETPAGDYALAWTAPFSGLFRAILYTDFVGSLSLLEGGCNGGLYDCSSGDNTIDFEAIEGQSYTFVIDGEFEGGFAFELYPFDVMPGGCPDGFVFAPEEPVFGTTVDGSDDFASDCGGAGAPDRSFLFVPDQSGIYHIDTFGSTFDTVLHLIEGECEGPTLACNDDWLDSLESGLDVALSAGVPYTIVVDGFGNAQGDFQLNVSFADEPLPPGVCAGIIDLPSEPLLVETWPVGETMADVWNQCVPMPSERRYRWQAPFSGPYQLTQVADGPAAISIVNGGCNGGSSTCEFTPGGEDNVVTFDAEVGQELVFVSEWGPVVSSEVMLMLAPLDGGCGQDLGSELPIGVAGTTVGGGDDHTGSCATNDTPDVEFSWTAPVAGTYKFTLEGSSYDTLMFILDGGCQGMELACNDDTMTNFGLELWSTIELDLVAGQTVAVIVDGYNGTGEFMLSITQI